MEKLKECWVFSVCRIKFSSQTLIHVVTKKMKRYHVLSSKFERMSTNYWNRFEKVWHVLYYFWNIWTNWFHCTVKCDAQTSPRTVWALETWTCFRSRRSLTNIAHFTTCKKRKKKRKEKACVLEKYTSCFQTVLKLLHFQYIQKVTCVWS